MVERLVTTTYFVELKNYQGRSVALVSETPLVQYDFVVTLDDDRPKPALWKRVLDSWWTRLALAETGRRLLDLVMFRLPATWRDTRPQSARA